MDEIISKFDKVLSLGSNCFIKKYIDSLGVKQETHFCDYIGTSIWGLYELFNNEFNDVFQPTDYVVMRILTDGDQYIVTNKKYYLIFKHMFTQNHQISNFKILRNEFFGFKETYSRRIKRLTTLLTESKNILWLRLEESDERIKHDIYAKKYEESELSQLIQFSQLLKIRYPNCLFTYIFIFTDIDKSMYLDEYRILVLKNTTNIKNYLDCENKIHHILMENMEMVGSIPMPPSQ